MYALINTFNDHDTIIARCRTAEHADEINERLQRRLARRNAGAYLPTAVREYGSDTGLHLADILD